jgi:hypothetical protein
MDKILELLGKYVPVPLTVAILAIATTFFGVHYWRGFRDYTDTMRDNIFLSAIIVVGAVVVLYFVNRQPAPTSSKPMLVVPYFENDEREQYRTALSSQLEQALARTGMPSGSVYRLPALLNDRESAVGNAKRLGAVAAVYDAKVIREKDSIKACFHIAYGTEGTQPYALVPLELPAQTVDAISVALVGTVAGAEQGKRNPVLSRLEALENQVASLRAAVDRAAAQTRVGAVSIAYKEKVALVVGVDRLRRPEFSLRFAESDAKAFANTMIQLGFRTTLFLGSDATFEQVMAALTKLRHELSDDDLAVLYYAGPSLMGEVNGMKKEVVLPFSDSDMNTMTSVLSISRLAEELQSLPARHRLAVVDGCHGTAGLDKAQSLAGLSAAGSPNERVAQILAGSNDDQYGLESTELGGGAFTQAMLRVLSEARDNQGVLWMHEFVARTTRLVQAGSSGKQTPKVVTLSGQGEISFESLESSAATKAAVQHGIAPDDRSPSASARR